MDTKCECGKPWRDCGGIPGKFEGTGCQRRTARLYELSMNGCDEEKGGVAFALWVGRIGRYHVAEDSYGFFDFNEYDTVDEAEKAFGEIDGD